MANNGGVYTWSKTAGLNSGADSTVNWAEGQAPSSINDSARSEMASVAKWRDDISGAIITTGTSAAYIVASNQIFDSLADFNGQVIAFSPHITNAAGPITVTVDGFANLPLRSSPGKELLAGTIIQGTPYLAVYNNTDGALYLQGFFGQPNSIPLFGGMDFWDTITPGSQFIFPAGQAISRTTYATAFARWGTKFGVGDGSTTFNVPDKTGRVSAMIEASATRLTSSWFGGNSTAIGAIGGAEKNALSATNQLPQFTPTVASNGLTVPIQGSVDPSNIITAARNGQNGTGLVQLPVQGTITFTPIGLASPSSFETVQPTITCNYILRVI